MKEENQSSKLAKMKENLQKMMKKRWALPAIYLGLAALVLSAGLWLQATDQTVQEDPNLDKGEIYDRDIGVEYEDALPVIKSSENFQKRIIVT